MATDVVTERAHDSAEQAARDAARETARERTGRPAERGLSGEGRRITLVLAVVSGAGLALELTLTRLFSLYYQYHFVFLAVSLAVLGLSLGAAWEHFRTPDREPADRPERGGSRNGRSRNGGRNGSNNDGKNGRHAPDGSDAADMQTRQTGIGLMLGISGALLLVAFGFSWLPIGSTILFHALLSLVPFVLIGRFLSFVFGRYAAHSGRLYAADLAGAAVGVVGVLILLSLVSAFTVVIGLGVLIAALALVGVLTRARGLSARLTQIAPILLAAGAIMLILNLLTGVFDFQPSRLRDAPRDKTMLTILNDPSQEARITYTEYSPFARVDVVEANDPNARYLFNDGGAGSFMLNYDGTPERVAYLKNTVEYLPFTAVPAGDALILGAGGGKDIVMARLAGASSVTALEVNPAMVSATRRFADYNGGILDLPGVTTITGDARSFAERGTGSYDLIYLNLVYTQSADPAGQALVENYIFTWQAFRAYLERLKPGGHLALVTHNALEGSRAALTAIQAMQDMGIAPSQALDHLVLWMYPADDATLRTGVLLIGKSPLAPETIATLGRGARAQRMQPLFVPREYETLFSTLRQGGTIERFVQAGADFDLSPTDDDRPYFYHLNHGLPGPIGAALAWAVILAALISVLAFTRPNMATAGRSWPVLALYAALIGAGFMLVEIPLMQRFGLLLGQPILSIAAVLGGLLLASGLGSLISARWPEARLRAWVPVAALLIAGLAVLYRFALPPLAESMLAAPLAVRLLVALGLTALIGIPMGIPFPSLLRLAGGVRGRVAMLWALNGAFSVLGSTLAITLSMLAGFSWALLLGAALYLALAGLVRVAVRA